MGVKSSQLEHVCVSSQFHTLTCVSKLYVDLQDYILNNSQNMVLHMHLTVVILMHRHCTVTTLMHGHCTGIARASR